METEEAKWCRTYWARIYMGGDFETATGTCRKFCEQGLCVNIRPIEYVYLFGVESGFCVELINYPRFPSTPEELVAQAEKLARQLLSDCSQMSYSIMTPDTTFWYSRGKPR